MHNEIVLQGFLVKKKNEISASTTEKIRNLNISAQVEASIRSAILGGGGLDAIKNSISKGFNQGNEHIENLKNTIEYRSDYFQYGNPESLSKIKEIENSPDFDKWVDVYTIHEIKKSMK